MKKDDPTPNLKYLPKNRSDASSFQPPPGYEIGGDAVPEHHSAPVRPVVTDSHEEPPSMFQPPRGQIAGDDLEMKLPEEFAGATDNVMGGSTLAEIRREPFGYIPLTDNPSLESLNPSKVDAAEKPLPAGFLGRSGGWER